MTGCKIAINNKPCHPSLSRGLRRFLRATMVDCWREDVLNRGFIFYIRMLAYMDLLLDYMVEFSCESTHARCESFPCFPLEKTMSCDHPIDIALHSHSYSSIFPRTLLLAFLHAFPTRSQKQSTSICSMSQTVPSSETIKLQLKGQGSSKNCPCSHATHSAIFQKLHHLLTNYCGREGKVQVAWKV